MIRFALVILIVALVSAAGMQYEPYRDLYCLGKIDAIDPWCP